MIGIRMILIRERWEVEVVGKVFFLFFMLVVVWVGGVDGLKFEKGRCVEVKFEWGKYVGRN